MDGTRAKSGWAGKNEESVSSRDAAEVEAQKRGTVRFLGELRDAVCVCSRNLPCVSGENTAEAAFRQMGWVLGIR